MSARGPTDLPTSLPDAARSGLTGLGTDLGSLPTERDPPGAAGGLPVSPDAKTGIDAHGPAAEAAARPPAPRGKFKVGLYEVMEELGRGGMGAVYRAWHPMRRKYVALKVINPDLGGGGGEKLERLKALFLREGGILMSLSHENVVGCYDANEAVHDGKPVLYMALELLLGESLLERIAKKGPLPPREAAQVARDLAKALHALHTHPQKIIHRDLKPANAFLTRDGAVKLLDFGLAGVADWKLTQVSMFAAGSRPYMAPEQFDGLRFCTARSDLYSLGVTVFQMVTGKLPFEADTDNAFLRAHKEKSPPLMADAVPALKEARLKEPILDALQNVVTRLLAKRPDERYQSAAEVVAALETALGGGTILVPKVTRPEAVRLRNRLAAVVGVLLVAAAIVIGTLVYGMSGASRRTSEAEALAKAGAFDDADALVEEVLKFNPEFAPAQELKGRIAKLRQEIRQVDEARTAARALLAEARGGGAPEKHRAAIVAARGVVEQARASGAVSATALAALQGEVEEAEGARARAFDDAAGAAEAALVAAERDAPAIGGSPARVALDAALATASALALEGDAGEAERRRLAEMRKRGDAAEALSRAKGDLALARGALDRGERDNAGAILERLARASLPAEVAEARAALAHDHALAVSVAARWAEAETALRDHEHERAAELGKQVRDALAAGGPALEARAGASVARADALLAKAGKGGAIAALKAAVQAKMVAEVRRALPEAEAEGAAASETALVEQARTLLYDDALARAKGILARGGAPEEARQAAIAALRALPIAQEPEMAALAARFERERGEKGDPAARDALRERLYDPSLAPAEAAWLLLESAAARAGLDPTREALFERGEGVKLGTEDAALRKSNPPHVARLAPFYLDKRETTVAEYARAVAAGKAKPSVCWQAGKPVAGTEASPAYGIHAEDARACAAAGTPARRLPTADEWEVAASVDPARPGARRRFPWGNEFDKEIAPREVAADDPPPAAGSNTHDVTPWGGLDMGGSVSEWVQEVDAAGRETPVLMGGSFTDFGEKKESLFLSARRRPAAFHALDAQMQRDVMFAVGFRCARDAAVPSLAEIAAR